VACALLAGCTSYKGSKEVAQVGGGLILGTAVVGGYVVEKTDVTLDDAAPTMFLLIGTGIVVGLLGVGGMIVHGIIPDDEQPKAATPPPPPPPPLPDANMMSTETRRRAAWDLLQAARIAGYRNDCPRVADLGARVIELDRAIYDEYFVRDPYVLRCTPPPR